MNNGMKPYSCLDMYVDGQLVKKADEEPEMIYDDEDGLTAYTDGASRRLSIIDEQIEALKSERESLIRSEETMKGNRR